VSGVSLFNWIHMRIDRCMVTAYTIYSNMGVNVYISYAVEKRYLKI
jgi:hypothetical protein